MSLKPTLCQTLTKSSSHNCHTRTPRSSLSALRSATEISRLGKHWYSRYYKRRRLVGITLNECCKYLSGSIHVTTCIVTFSILQKPEFKAQPLPDFGGPSLPLKVVQPITNPQPFSLLSEIRGQKYNSKWIEKVGYFVLCSVCVCARACPLFVFVGLFVM